MSRYLLHIALVAVLSASCRVDPEIVKPLPALPSGDLEQVIPDSWPQPVYRFEGNEINEDKFILGRALFYEPMLSRDNSISCGSCHQQAAAFAHFDHDFSHGVSDKVGTRNSPGLFNLAWHPYFMHDGGVNHIEVQPSAPIANPVEMDEDIANVVSKLRTKEAYRKMFRNAWGEDTITTQRMLKSIAVFMGLMTSYNSRYDKYKRGEAGGTMSDAEIKGYASFITKCSGCHKEPLFTDFAFRNNGLSVNPLLNDSGRIVIDDLTSSLYKFKTPSLRNVDLTGPYMHDGRYTTLEQCLDHYTDKVVNMTNLDPILYNDGGISLTSDEKKNIIAFLRTLTDYTFLNDRRFADPNGPQ